MNIDGLWGAIIEGLGTEPLKNALLTLFALSAIASPTIGAGSAVRGCPTLASDPIGLTVHEMVDRSSVIVLATSIEFRSSAELPPHLGIYSLEVIRVIKKRTGSQSGIGPLEITGLEPYQSIPQYYIDTTSRHERLGDVFSPAYFNKLEIDGECKPFFRGLNGYTYIVFFEDGKMSAFDLINDSEGDELLKRVMSAVK